MKFLYKIKTSTLGKVFQYSLIKYIALGFGFLKGIINAKFLGPELLGIVGNLILILGYCSYANLGVLHSMNREYVLAKEESNEEGESVLSTTFTFLILISTVFIILSISSILIYKNKYGLYLSLVFIIAIFEQFRSYFVNYFRLINNYNMINLIEIIYGIISFILTIILINNLKIYGVLFSMLICGIAVFIFGIIKIKNIKLKINRAILKNLISIGIPLLIYNLGFYILSTVDRWIIIKYFTDVDLGYYTFANSMVSATLVFISSMLFLLYPKLIKEFNENKSNNICEKIKVYTRLLEISSAVFFTIGIVLFKPFIIVFLNKYIDSIKIYMILLLSIIINNLAYFSNIYIVSNKKQKILVYLQILTIGINIIFNFIFVKLGLGIEGVALGTLIANSVYSFSQYMIFLKLSSADDKVIYTIRVYGRIIIYSIITILMILNNVNYIIQVITIISLTIILYIKEIRKIKEYINLAKNN